MLSDAEAAELRELRRLAYAPEGALSDARVRRLEHLERRRVAGAGAPVAASDSADNPSAQEERNPEDTVGAAEESRHEESTGPVLVPASRRRRWIPAALAVGLVVLGSVGGWALAQTQQAPASVPVTDAQRDHVLASLPEGADQGSLLALGEREGVVAWYVTAQSGSDTCLLLDDGADVVTACRGSEYLADTPLSVSRQVERGDETEYLDVTFATLVLTPDGRPAVEMDGYRAMGGGIVYANDAETETAAAIAESGYLRDTIYVMGHWDGIPVWSASRSGSELCVVFVPVADEILSDCADPSSSDPVTAVIGFVEVDGIEREDVQLTLSMGATTGSYLTITQRSWTEGGPGEGDQAIDDTTGEVED